MVLVKIISGEESQEKRAPMTQNQNLYKKCLTTKLMIMLNLLVFIHNCGGREIPEKYGSDVSSSVALRHQKNFHNTNNCSMGENGRTKLLKNWHRRLRDLNRINLKLRNVIDRYNDKKNELNALFLGLSHYGFNRNESIYRNLVSENKKLKDFKCRKFRQQKALNKRTYELLLEFKSTVQSFHEAFQILIKYEKLPHFVEDDRSDGRRLKLLNILKNDLKTLQIEVAEILDLEKLKKNKRLNFSIQPKKKMALMILPPESQTDLIFREGYLIQHSKTFLNYWNRKLHKIFKCWRKKVMNCVRISA